MYFEHGFNEEKVPDGVSRIDSSITFFTICRGNEKTRGQKRQLTRIDLYDGKGTHLQSNSFAGVQNSTTARSFHQYDHGNSELVQTACDGSVLRVTTTTSNGVETNIATDKLGLWWKACTKTHTLDIDGGMHVVLVSKRTRGDGSIVSGIIVCKSPDGRHVKTVELDSTDFITLGYFVDGKQIKSVTLFKSKAIRSVSCYAYDPSKGICEVTISSRTFEHEPLVGWKRVMRERLDEHGNWTHRLLLQTMPLDFEGEANPFVHCDAQDGILKPLQAFDRRIYYSDCPPTHPAIR